QRQPRADVAVADDQRHAERDGDRRRRRHHGDVDAPTHAAGLIGAAREHAWQEEQAGEPDGDRRDVEKLQPEIHRRLLPLACLLAGFPADASAHAADAGGAGLAIAWLAFGVWYAA